MFLKRTNLIKYCFNSFLFFFMLITSATTSAEDIYLPVISQEVKDRASQLISNAREDAFYAADSINNYTGQNLDDLINAAKKNIQKQNATINSLLNKTINNKQWQARKQMFKNNINNFFGVDPSSENQNNKDNIISGHRLYLFVSSSIPQQKMREYARQLSKYPNSQMILRGFIGGAKKIKPTLEYIRSIIAKNPGCIGSKCQVYKTIINIDPVLFARYGVSRVPTLVYVNEISGPSYCSEGKEIVSSNGVHTFVGLAPLKYMIRELSSKTKLTKLQQLEALSEPRQ